MFTNRFSPERYVRTVFSDFPSLSRLGVGLDPRQMPKVTESNWNMARIECLIASRDRRFLLGLWSPRSRRSPPPTVVGASHVLSDALTFVG